MNLFYEEDDTNKSELILDGYKKYMKSFLENTTFKNRTFYQACRKLGLIPRLFIINGEVLEWLDTRSKLNRNQAHCIYCGTEVILTSNGRICHSKQKTDCISIKEADKTIHTETKSDSIKVVAATNKMTKLSEKKLKELQEKAEQERKQRIQQTKREKSWVTNILRKVKI